jgi:hypothetical protein
MSRKARLKLLTLALALVIALAVGEVCVRLFGLGETNSYRLINDSFYVSKPHLKLLNRVETNNWVVLNNFGFHDVNRQVSNANYRIVVLGDSFVQADQVPTEASFTRVLERRFAESGRKHVEVVNCGLSGQGTAHEYRMWRDYVDGTLRLRYDHALLAIYLGNDLVDNSRPLAVAPMNYGWYLDADGTVFTHRIKENALKRLLRGVREHSALLNRVYQDLYRLKRKYLKRQKNEERQAALAQADVAARRKGWSEAEWKHLRDSAQGTLKLLERWAGELRTREVRFDVVLIPSDENHARHEFYRQFIQELEQAGARAGFGVLYLEMDQRLAEFYFPAGGGYGHFNEQGHTFAAEALHTWLTRRYQFATK